MSAVRIRDGTAADVARCNQIWVSTQPELDGRELPDLPLPVHEVRTGRLAVAETAAGIVGFGATFTRSGVMYLADLFVEPHQQGSGVGGQLMHALCHDHDGPLFTFASSDPRAQRLYEQFGMCAIEQYHYLDAAIATLAPWASDVELIEAAGDEVLDIDAALTGRDRLADIDYAISLGATWFVARRGGRALGAVAVVAPTWWNPWHPAAARVGPVMADDPADVEPVLGAALGALQVAAPHADVASTFAPAGHPVLPALLGAGFEIVDTDLLMASDPALIDGRRYLPTVDTP